jgi:cytochrome b561
MDRPKRYHPVHVTLHWLVALGVFINLYLGIFVFSQRGRGSSQYLPIHMAVGITILVLLLVRLVLRFTVKRPAVATAGHKLLDIIAQVVHYGLYLSVLTVIVLGVVFTAQNGGPQSVFTDSWPEFNGPPLIHRMVAYLVAFLLGMHILAALYHQFICRDNLFARMWYGSR